MAMQEEREAAAVVMQRTKSGCPLKKSGRGSRHEGDEEVMHGESAMATVITNKLRKQGERGGSSHHKEDQKDMNLGRGEAEVVTNEM